jgi:hypothetical protein
VVVTTEVVAVGVGDDAARAGPAAVEVKLGAAKLKIVRPFQHHETKS